MNPQKDKSDKGPIQPGMLVSYKYHPNEQSNDYYHKLKARYSIPWRVTKQLRNTVTYEICHPIRQETKLINRDQLIIFRPRKGYISTDLQDSIPRYFSRPENRNIPNNQLYPQQIIEHPAGHNKQTKGSIDSDANTNITPSSTLLKLMQPLPNRSLRATAERRSRRADPNQGYSTQMGL